MSLKCRLIIPTVFVFAVAFGTGTLPDVYGARRLAAAVVKGYEELMAEWGRPIRAAAIRRLEGSQSRVAAALGMHRSTLREKLRAYGLIDTAKSSSSQ